MERDTAKLLMLPSRLGYVVHVGRHHVSWIGVAIFLLAGCGGSSPSGQSVASSPSPDQMTQRYVALVHSYWIAYKSVEGDVPTFARVCWGQLALSPSATHDPTASPGIPSVAGV